MTGPFGGPVPLLGPEAADGTLSVPAIEAMDRVRRVLADLGQGGPGMLRIYRPQPTAAFAPSDRAAAAYDAAAAAMQGLGFEPVERLAGGRLAVYDRHAVVVDLVAPHPAPRLHVLERFDLFARALAAALKTCGVDARVGALPGEYCPGEHSVNGGGRIKLSGVAQRIGRQGYHMGAVISVTRSEPARLAVAQAYAILGLDFDPSTFGALSDFVPDCDFAVLRRALLDSLSTLLEIRTAAE